MNALIAGERDRRVLADLAKGKPAWQGPAADLSDAEFSCIGSDVPLSLPGVPVAASISRISFRAETVAYWYRPFTSSAGEADERTITFASTADCPGTPAASHTAAAHRRVVCDKVRGSAVAQQDLAQADDTERVATRHRDLLDSHDKSHRTPLGGSAAA